MKGAIRDQKGAAPLTLVLILLVLGGLILMPLLGLLSTGLISGQVYENKMQEYYAADAGVESAIWLLRSGSRDAQDLPEFTLNGDTVNVRIDTTTDTKVYRITSTATANDKSTTIVAYVEFPPGLFDNALTAMGDENAQGGTITKEGDGSAVIDAIPSDPNRVVIFANGSISLGAHDVIGRVKASDTITVKSATDPPGPYPAPANTQPFDFGPLIQTLKTQIIEPAKVEAQNVTPPADFPINPDQGYWTIEAGTWKIRAAGNYAGNNHVGPGDCVISAPAGNNLITMEGTLIVDGALTTGGFYDQIFNGPVWVKGGPLHDKTTEIKALNFNGKPHVTTFNDIVYIDGNLQITSNSGNSTINFEKDVYVGGFLYVAAGKGEVNFNGNVYVGAAHGFSSGYCLRFENGNVHFGGKVYVNDPRSGPCPDPSTITTFYSSAKLNVSGSGPIIIKNSMTLSGGSAELNDIPLIMSEFGDIYSPAGPDITSYLYAPYGKVKWGGAGAGTVTGGITAKTIALAGGVKVAHAVLPVSGGNSSGIAILSWDIS